MFLVIRIYSPDGAPENHVVKVTEGQEVTLWAENDQPILSVRVSDLPPGVQAQDMRETALGRLGVLMPSKYILN